MTAAPREAGAVDLPELPATDFAMTRMDGGGPLYTADQMHAYARAALAAGLGGWRPIESAPRDGSCVLVGDGDGREAYPAFWHDGSQCYGHRGGEGWFSEDERTNLLCASNVHPVAYMPWPVSQPLPSAPSSAPQESPDA